MHPSHGNGSRRSAVPTGLALGALGVVFGDLATSPLYAFRQCFLGDNAPQPTAENIVAIASLFFWTLVCVVCIKYSTFLMHANHDGEGGTLALLGLLYPTDPLKAATAKSLPWIALTVLFGTAALYGDGVITPAISVLSAVEGIRVATPAAAQLTVPITVIILIGLFTLQTRGTERIGKLFGPVMLVWCLSIIALGANAIVHNPAILVALNPLHALRFVFHVNPSVIVVLGGTVLCVSGAEALYADLGHFGATPIRIAWYAAVFPALALAYLGQGALALQSPKQWEFYSLVPPWFVIPMVIIATAATIVASQALISGAFSLTQQAMHLGYLPRLAIVHTSHAVEGQIFLPFVNTMLAIVCVLLVITFRASAKLGDAYGLAVTLTMLTTTIAYAALTVRWRWPGWQTVLVIGLFLCFDLSFLIGNIPKIPSGGWIPLLIAIGVFTIFVTWYRGRRRQARVLLGMTTPVEDFLKELETRPPTNLIGTAIFLTAHPTGVPYVLNHAFLRTRVMYERVVLMTIVYERRPRVPLRQRVVVEELHKGSFYRVTAHYGFMETPKTLDILVRCRSENPNFDFTDATFFVSESTIIPAKDGQKMSRWSRLLFTWMLTNSRPIESSIHIPPDRIVRLGVAIPV